MASVLLLNVQNALVRFGDKTLFDGLSFALREGEKICLVGKNGAGKTTLMNVMTGAHEPDAGEVWRLAGASAGYMQQEVLPKKGQTVRQFVFEHLQNKDGSHDYKIERVIEPLQLGVDDLMTELSGGQLRRAALARALVEEPDILLLDEPTNHLDLDVIEWLETYLRGYRGAVVCVSHDKAFLTNVTNRVFWLDRGRLKICPKGFGFFDEWSTMILEQEERELLNRQKLLDQEVEWASRGVKARRKRNVRRLDLMKSERDKLRHDKNALNRMLAKIDVDPIDIEQGTSKIAAEFHNVFKSFGDGKKVIFDKFNLRIQRGDRIGIVGRNGSGKTSFLRLLVKEIAPDAGTVKVAKDLVFSYFDQNRKDLKPDHSLHRVLCPNGSDYIEVMGKTRHVCGYLKDFLFDPKTVSFPVSTLSGGQKNRLMLAKVLANPGSLLILDEPTNDLDMDTLDRLEEILTAYQGTLIVVSHDRDFLDQTTSKILAFYGEGKVEAIIGGYQDYLTHRDRVRAMEEEKSSGRKKEGGKKTSGSAKSKDAEVEVRAKTPQKLSYALQFKLDRLPGTIAALEASLRATEAKMADPDLYANDPEAFHKLSAKLASEKEALEKAEIEWLELEEKRAALEDGL